MRRPRKTRSRCSCGFDFTAEKNRHRRKCGDCGVPRIAKTKPKHAAALDLPYGVFLELNGGVDACGICGATKKPGGKALHRDHDHRRNVPRGLLCFPCNAALRPYMTLEWVEAAARYLRRTA